MDTGEEQWAEPEDTCKEAEERSEVGAIVGAGQGLAGVRSCWQILLGSRPHRKLYLVLH